MPVSLAVCVIVYSVTGSAVSLAGWLCVMSCLCVIGWLAVCGRIVPGVNRNCGESLAIGIAAADEIGGIGIAGHCRR